MRHPDKILLPDGRALTQAALDHQHWLLKDKEGQRLDLRGVDLKGVDLTAASLWGVDLAEGVRPGW